MVAAGAAGAPPRRPLAVNRILLLADLTVLVYVVAITAAVAAQAAGMTRSVASGIVLK